MKGGAISQPVCLSQTNAAHREGAGTRAERIRLRPLTALLCGSRPHQPTTHENNKGTGMTKRNSALRDKLRARIRTTKAGCHICGKPIDYTLPYLNPMSYVVDHVIPLAKGGRDAIENAKAAHRECNSKKRARIIAPIIRRSGTLD